MRRSVMVVLVLLLSACGQAPANETSSTPSSPSPTARDVEGCPVTVPPESAFVPPKPYPPDPGFGNVWYGTPELWTILESDGQVWRGLPMGDDGAIGDKTLWFSTNFSMASGADFSGDERLTLTAERLDASAPRVVQRGSVPSFNKDIKNFMLAGFALHPGCWAITATYQGADLSYTLLVEG